MDQPVWSPPAIQLPEPVAPANRRSRRKAITGVAVLGTGVVAGAVLGSTLISGAATPTAPSAPAASTAPDSKAGHPGLALSGTVVSHDTTSVTIKTSSGAVRYTVTSSSDIDKNGEAQLSSLAPGDAVRFSTTAASSTTIDKLHAGSEALDRPLHGSMNGRWHSNTDPAHEAGESAQRAAAEKSADAAGVAPSGG
jgi:hypothetical protein